LDAERVAAGALKTSTFMKDLFIRETFTRERSAARKLAKEYFERFPS
jgi:hypothetical protein